ncbi:RNA dependent RNA polymerase-domain-containing protein [Phascolomyces articulosus]|uniref:RNA-dependent RNA polymerase n=1 Tax=Phascolomyces articulosus TaxID=60185 RepID=A0AAD5JR39_9FUNG|nr:RNA dependent RNA polymerase-domain-containing protein [Phascolomyces articulosus]
MALFNNNRAYLGEGVRSEDLIVSEDMIRSIQQLSMINRAPSGQRRNMNNFQSRSAHPRQSSTVYGESFSMGYMSTPTTFVEPWKTNNNVRFNYNYTTRMVTIFFRMGNPTIYYAMRATSTTYKVEFHIKALMDSEIMVEQFDTSGDHVAFTMKLKCAGKFWKEKSTTQSVHGHPMSVWERCVSFDDENFRSDGAQTQQQHRQLGGAQLGSWTSYQAVPRGPIEPGVKINVAIPLPAITTRPLNHQERFQRIPHFEAVYTLESFISSYRLHQDNLTEEFYATLCGLPPLVAIEALKIICFKEDVRVWDPLKDLQALVKPPYYFGLQKLRHRSSHIAYVYKAMVTPTTMQLGLPQPEMTNRVIRHFKQYGDRFLRVQFVEEGLAPLVNTASTKFLISDKLFARIYQVITRGIHIGDRHYEFLAFSSSQLRTHGCWFFCATDDWNAVKIRQWMGDFQSEQVVAKHAARMGQCFSSTHPITMLEPNQIIKKEDVVHNNYTFSDGVGLIAPDLAQLVAKKMNRTRVPSAFQIRLGGAKGVLTVHQGMSPKTIELRKSQIKFETEYQMLEISNTANFSCAHLNRQLFTILNSLHVPDQSFLDLQEELIASVDKMLIDPREASRVLREISDGLGIFISMAKMAFRVNRLKEARKRARIPVIKGAYLMGVLDETNTLEPGQIFCPFIDGNSNNRVVKGECLVYRSPSLHPGDVRMLEAVECPQLMDLCNVVVFPAKGERDIPSMCSGGDLDGDCYSVIWDKRLFPPREYRNIIPMDYTAPAPLRVDRVTIHDIQKIFVNFIKSSNLGQIANAHLVRADYSDDGVFDPICIKLARLHSLAVDFAKTGRAANPNPMVLTIPSKRYPDFMEKKDKLFYPSRKALGKLYRSIDHIKYREYREALWGVGHGIFYDDRIQAAGMEKYIGLARRLKRYYYRELRDLMGRFGVDSEAEMMSGYIIKWLHKKRNERLFEIQYQARKDMIRMKKRWYQTEFCNKKKTTEGAASIAGMTFLQDKKELEAKASAFYYVTYHPHEQRRAQDQDREFDNRFDGQVLMSFPWVAQDILCAMVKRKPRPARLLGVEGGNTSLNYPTFDEETIAMYDPGEPPSDNEAESYSESDYGSEYDDDELYDDMLF